MSGSSLGPLLVLALGVEVAAALLAFRLLRSGTGTPQSRQAWHLFTVAFLLMAVRGAALLVGLAFPALGAALSGPIAECLSLLIGLCGLGGVLQIGQVFAVLRRDSVELEARLLERRQSLERLEQTEAQLRQAQRLEAVGRLAGGIAHDFNNLLTVITGYSELALLDRDLRGESRAGIEEVRRAGERASALTRQLLAFSRRQVLEPRVLDLNAVVGDMDKMIRRLIRADIHVETHLTPDLGRVKVDPGQMEQVIVNLVVNARDAMPEGGRLTIETANVEVDDGYARTHVDVEPGPYVMLAVSDDGHGMDAETLSRVFEPFFTTKGDEHGTGLGLATVYGIVRQSGGSIWVYSEPGRGATFKVYLPRVQEAVEEAPAPQPAPVASGEGETVLLVEDEPTLRPLVREILRAGGYAVLEASNGVDALRICAQHRGVIHLAVTDLVMPEMGGIELARRLASTRPEMRVLFISGYTEASAVHGGITAAGMAYLQKPFTSRGLASKVREVLDSAPRAALAGAGGDARGPGRASAH